MRQLIVIVLLMPVLAKADIHLFVSIENNRSKASEFVGVTEISGGAADMVVRVTGESEVTSNGSFVGGKPFNYRAPAQRAFNNEDYIPLRKWEGTSLPSAIT